MGTLSKNSETSRDLRRHSRPHGTASLSARSRWIQLGHLDNVKQFGSNILFRQMSVCTAWTSSESTALTIVTHCKVLLRHTVNGSAFEKASALIARLDEVRWERRVDAVAMASVVLESHTLSDHYRVNGLLGRKLEDVLAKNAPGLRHSAGALSEECEKNRSGNSQQLLSGSEASLWRSRLRFGRPQNEKGEKKTIKIGKQKNRSGDHESKKPQKAKPQQVKTTASVNHRKRNHMSETVKSLTKCFCLLPFASWRSPWTKRSIREKPSLIRLESSWVRENALLHYRFTYFSSLSSEN